MEDPKGLIRRFLSINGLLLDDAPFDLSISILTKEVCPDYENVESEVEAALRSLFYPFDTEAYIDQHGAFKKAALSRLLKFRFRIVTKCKISTTSWPLGINPEKDVLASQAGLAHWSCLCVDGTDLWMRRDGERLRPSFYGENGWIADLHRFDDENLIGPFRL